MLELRDFITQPIIDITGAVKDAAPPVLEDGGAVNPSQVSGGGAGSPTWDRASGTYIQNVDFDIAGSAQEREGKRRTLPATTRSSTRC